MLLALGYSNQKIADTLSKSIRTIEGQVLSILDKLGYGNRKEFIAGARQSRADGSEDEQRSLDRLTLAVVERLREDGQDIIRASESVSSMVSQQLSKLPSAIESVVIRAFAQTQPRPRSRLAILGIATTGVAVATAAKAVGDDPLLVDLQTNPSDLSSQPTESEQYAEQTAKELHVPLLRNWRGPIRDLAPDQVIVSPGFRPDHLQLRQARKDGLPVMSEIEYAFQISKAPIVAITGTNGKTTTAVMTYLMLRAAGMDAILCGRIYGAGYEEMPFVEAAWKANSAQILVAEVSCFDLDFVSKFRPKVAAITNISPDHLNGYENFAAYLRSKRRLFSKMGAGDTVVCNSQESETIPASKKGLTLLRWSPKADGTDADAYIAEDALIICGHRISKQEFPFFLPFHFENAACASLLALAAGADPGDLHWISDGLRQYRGIAHRMELVGTRANVRFINNSMCTNPAALQSVVNSLSGPLRVLVGGVSKGMVFDKVLKAALDAHSVYLYGADARTINLALGGRWPVFELMEDALGAAIADAASGDTIILSPAAGSMDQFKDFIDRGDRFRELVKHHLER